MQYVVGGGKMLPDVGMVKCIQSQRMLTWVVMERPLVAWTGPPCSYIVFTFRYSYGFMFVCIYISVIANGGAHVTLYKALNRL